MKYIFEIKNDLCTYTKVCTPTEAMMTFGTIVNKVTAVYPITEKFFPNDEEMPVLLIRTVYGMPKIVHPKIPK